ncbi:yrdC domain-containing protein, mitochondrial [Brienomyrus brachyistius]|uniref:yrdC domain-containing protein, mitochondrial n=1 Tax=Brienomyrus brachyistius TaxID=42636 RepID=UPI0020B357F7|nr:yrdC domain-containing protein, mitochondrial [Brienomyrus brachyistius]
MRLVRFVSNIATPSRLQRFLMKQQTGSTVMCKELRTRVLRLGPGAFNGPLAEQVCPEDTESILESTVQALKEGHVVAVPTDTIYGLACLAQNSEAVGKVYDIKGRHSGKPLAICVGEVEDVYKYCKVTVPETLLRDLLPGPVTLVMERSDKLNQDLNPFTSLVGVRIPDHPFIRRLSQMCAEPLALTSANVSYHTSTVAVHEFQELWSRLALVVDGGPIGDQTPQSRLGSTVVDLSATGRYSIIRQGCAAFPTVTLLEERYGLIRWNKDWDRGD